MRLRRVVVLGALFLLGATACDRANPAFIARTTVPGADAGEDAAAALDAGATDARDASSPLDARRRDAPSSSACPDLTGRFALETQTEACDDLPAGYRVCARATDEACVLRFDSGDDQEMLIGIVVINQDGRFEGATLRVGDRTGFGCKGRWEAASSRLTVECGECTAVLRRLPAQACEN